MSFQLSPSSLVQKRWSLLLVPILWFWTIQPVPAATRPIRGPASARAIPERDPSQKQMQRHRTIQKGCVVIGVYILFILAYRLLLF